MIQFFRAISIIAVVMIHTTPYGECQVFCRPFINFSVATFLFLSGYLTKIENDNWCFSIKKRIIRVIVPYIIWTIIYTMPSLISGGGGWLLIENLLTAKAAGTLYYIFVYIQFVLLAPFLSLLAKSKYRHLGWFVAPISILIFKYYGLLTGTQTSEFLKLLWSNSCLGWFTFFYLGLMLGNRVLQPNFSLKKLELLYFVSIIFQMGEGYVWYVLGESNYGTQIKITSLITSTLCMLIIYTILNTRSLLIKNRFLLSLGDYSFGIYLSHIMVLMILERISIYAIIPYPLTSVIVVLISWGCCKIGRLICGKQLSGFIGLQ